ncbi:thiamine pyrophosphate-binding protein [Paenibacillus sp. YYML68]|uniref:thiamine pyrophosphate-binding protein n=1 Tax=Paenibacillus sp. YYML68 TaxID=2909250 RepID=UPI002491B893|nr:thiamine pyrophosphate-binding protein [Paenibacillus sp. YYML68]
MTPTVMDQKNERQQAEPVNADAHKPDQGLSVAPFILEQLAAWGVERIYGVIGDANLLLLDAIGKQNKIRFVPFLDENAAALAASAEAKLTGRVGVVLGTSGPGLTNMLNGLGDAYADAAGVIAITGQVDAPKVGTHTKQYIQQQVMVAPLATFSEQLAHADALPDLLLRCLVMSGVQGGVSHLSIPKLMFQDRVQGVVQPYSPHFHQSLLAPQRDVEETFQLIAEAKRPMLLYGRGVSGAEQAALSFAEAIGAAVTTSMPAKHVFPNEHELFVGGLGLAGSEAASVLMAESDLVIICGSTWWPDEYTPPAARVVQIDAVRHNIGINHSLQRGLVGDLKEILPQFVQMSGKLSQRGGNEEWKRRIAEARGQWTARLQQEASAEGSPIAPQRLMQVLSEQLPKDAVIALDTGDHSLWFNRCFTNRGQRVLLSGRWRTLGFALPAAIAAKLAEPARPVVAIAGDGGVVQTIVELKTAVKLGLGLTLLVLNNGSYAIEKNRMELEGLELVGSELDNPDFVKLAEACGAVGCRAQTVEELRDCLRKAGSESRPVLIDVAAASLKVPHTKL